MLNKTAIESAIFQIKNLGAESFLKEYALFEKHDIENIFHYTSLLPVFEKFIYFKDKKISLVLSEKKTTLYDFLNKYTLTSSNYNFRDDISRVKIQNLFYITINGKLEQSSNPIVSIDVKGNIYHLSKIEVNAIVVELNDN